jgi:hypothetical protein
VKKETEYPIRKFKLDPSSWWVGYFHFSIVNGKLICAAGGNPPEEAWEKIKTYLKRQHIKFE